MKRAVLLFVAALVLVLPACGKDKPAKTAADTGGSTTTSSTVAGAGGGSGGGASSTTTAPKVGAQGGQGTTTTTAAGGTGGTTSTTAPVQVTVKLKRDCVRKGANGDLQGIEVQTRPGDNVGYSTEYSGRQNEMNNPEFKTGYGYGKSDTSGGYIAEWKLPDTANDGPAILRVIADGKLQPELHFKVVGLTGKC